MDYEKIKEIFNEKLLKELVVNTEPGKFEITYSVSQLFETGIRVTYWYVIRDKKIIYYKEKIEKSK